MGQPKDLRAYPPRFWEVLERVAQGETVVFRFPKTEEGRRRCHYLLMRLGGFRAAMRAASPEEVPELLIAAAWDLSTPKINKWEFHARPTENFDEELSRALDTPLENNDD